MNAGAGHPVYYVGWDVGGWNCDKNALSRDAIVVLDAERQLIGRPWRGNLRATINNVGNSIEWIEALFDLCGANRPKFPIRLIMAIDTPLGFPEALSDLMAGTSIVAELEESSSNPYLFRVTEKFLFEQGITPLSAVKDMIGSQATKGMHLVAKLRFDRIHCGLWVHGGWFAAIEAYPSPCRRSVLVDELLRPFALYEGRLQETTDTVFNHPDKVDALTCALIAYCFDARAQDLVGPIESAPASEGWIWLPRDVVPLDEDYKGAWRETMHIGLEGDDS